MPTSIILVSDKLSINIGCFDHRDDLKSDPLRSKRSIEIDYWMSESSSTRSIVLKATDNLKVYSID